MSLADFLHGVPLLQMRCQVCKYCQIYKGLHLKYYCTKNGYYVYSGDEVCFDYKPLSKDD